MLSHRRLGERGRQVLPPAITRVGAAASFLAILVATLTPAGQDALVGGGFFCLWCGGAPLANLLRNFLLFLPLGFFSFAVWPSLVASVVLGAVVSGTVEFAQMFIPGRNPFLVDWLANSAGAFAGAAAAQSLPFWIQGTGRAQRWALGALLAIAALAAAAPGWLLSSDPPRFALWVHWNHQVRPFGPYPGAVVEARIGDLPLNPGRIPDEYDPYARWAAGDTLTVQFVAATADRGSRGLLRVVSGPSGRELVTLLVDGPSLAASTPLHADRFGLTRPRQTAPQLLAGVGPGDTVTIAISLRGDGGLDILGPAHQWRGPGIEPAMGWSLLYFPAQTGRKGSAAIGFAWCGLLLFIPATVAAGRTGAIMTLIVMIAVLGIAPLFLHHVGPLPVTGWAGAVVGWTGGRAVRHGLRRRWRVTGVKAEISQ